eukprot:m.46318 g.46318  ORF g.46318 m.46318 type:complete len:182 (+) comp11849_c0_seq2:2611-3156(+)
MLRPYPEECALARISGSETSVGAKSKSSSSSKLRSTGRAVPYDVCRFGDDTAEGKSSPLPGDSAHALAMTTQVNGLFRQTGNQTAYEDSSVCQDRFASVGRALAAVSQQQLLSGSTEPRTTREPPRWLHRWQTQTAVVTRCITGWSEETLLRAGAAASLTISAQATTVPKLNPPQCPLRAW